MTDEITEFNQTQALDNQITIENKTALEVFDEFLSKTGIDAYTAQLAEHSRMADQELKMLEEMHDGAESGTSLGEGEDLSKAIADSPELPNITRTIDFDY